jgi:hypothetical protein
VVCCAQSLVNDATLTTIGSAYGTTDINSCSVDLNSLTTATVDGATYQFDAYYDNSGNINIARRPPGSSTWTNLGAGGGSGNGNEYFNVYDPVAKTWTNNLVIDGEQTSVNAYLNNLVYAANGKLEMSWTWRATPNWQTNSNIMYAQSPDNGTTWTGLGGGNPYTLPIIQSGSPSTSVGQVIKNISQGDSFINQTSMTADANSNPIIATYYAPGWHAISATAGSGNPNRQYMLVY